MKLLPGFFLMSVVLLLISQNEVYGSVVELLSPTFWLNKIVSFHPFDIFSSEATTPSTTTQSTTTIVDEDAQLEKEVFKLASFLQSCYNPSDLQAKENYIMSPVSVAILLGELLIGTYGWTHECVARLMGLNHRVPREVFVFEESDQALYDEKIYHSSYHYRLWILAKTEYSENREDRVSVKNAFFYNKNVDLVDPFTTQVNRFYQSDITSVSFDDTNTSTDPIIEWSTKNLEVDVANYTEKLLNAEMQSIFINTFLFNTTWQIPLERVKKKAEFRVKSYQTEKVRYLEGVINQTIYVDSENFTLVAIPLNHRSTNLYILLPKGTDFTNYNIRQFSEGLDNYEQFQKILNNVTALNDVKVKIPNVFEHFVEFDVMTPLLNYLNNENEIYDKPSIKNINLNRASQNLKLSSMVQHMYFSITNKTDTPMNGQSRTEDESVIVFEVTRPFVFIIMDHTTHVALVWGSISDPTKLQ